MMKLKKIPMLATTRGREHAVAKLKERRKANVNRKRIDNSSLRAGSYMYYYCIACGDVADTLPEGFTGQPARLCPECLAMKDLGWLV